MRCAARIGCRDKLNALRDDNRFPLLLLFFFKRTITRTRRYVFQNARFIFFTWLS